MIDDLQEIIDITQTAQWQFSPTMCTCEAAQETMNKIYELAHRALGAHERRVTELLEANNREVERRRAAEEKLAAIDERIRVNLLALRPVIRAGLEEGIGRHLQLPASGCRCSLGDGSCPFHSN